MIKPDRFLEFLYLLTVEYRTFSIFRVSVENADVQSVLILLLDVKF
jgi:hypothetical protein